MNNKNKITLTTSLILVILLLVIGISYAYFSANIFGEEESTTITVTGGVMNIHYNGGADIKVSGIVPSKLPFATKRFTVTGNNTMDIEMGYKLSLVVTTNTFSSSALKYKLISINTDNNGSVVKSINNHLDISTGVSNINLGVGYFDVPTDGNKVHTYNLELYFLETNFNQNVDQGKEFNAHIKIENFDYGSSIYDDEKGVNKPVLFTGMIPIKWDEALNEIETTKDDPNWYDYNNKKWANARTQDGSYWVWIPRYAYKITNGYHKSDTGLVDIKFLKGKTINNDSNITVETNGYIAGVKDTSLHHFLHPSFDTEGSKLGFWIAKYDPTAAEGIETVTGPCNPLDDVLSKTIKIIPSATIWRCIDIMNAHTTTLNMKTNSVYGWNENEVDSHLLTNLEWGAVAYLSTSVYGAHTEEIWNNTFNGNRTGCSGTVADASSESVCVEYNTVNGQKASTTHNIYGVYDMSGGIWDRVMGYYNSDESNEFDQLASKYLNKYYTREEDLLNKVGMAYDKTIYGDAVYETSYNANRHNGLYGRDQLLVAGIMIFHIYKLWNFDGLLAVDTILRHLNL